MTSKTKTKAMNHELVDYIPDGLQDGVLYISEPYKTAAHKCCCGCGEEVITPLNVTDWSVKISAGRVSLYPSIGNWSFACRSHYWIKNGQVEWSYAMSAQAIQLGRDADRQIKDRHFKEVNDAKAANNLAWYAKAAHQFIQTIKGFFR